MGFICGIFCTVYISAKKIVFFFCKIVRDAQIIAQKFAFCLTTHIIPQIFSGKKCIFWRYHLRAVKNTANICDIFCRAQKKAQKIAVFFAVRKKYCKNYRKNIQKRSMTIANICDISCGLQKFV